MVPVASRSVSSLVSHIPDLLTRFNWRRAFRELSKPGARGTIDRDFFLRDSNLAPPPRLQYLSRLHLYSFVFTAFVRANEVT